MVSFTKLFSFTSTSCIPDLTAVKLECRRGGGLFVQAHLLLAPQSALTSLVCQVTVVKQLLGAIVSAAVGLLLLLLLSSFAPLKRYSETILFYVAYSGEWRQTAVVQNVESASLK